MYLPDKFSTVKDVVSAPMHGATFDEISKVLREARDYLAVSKQLERRILE